MLKRLPLHPLLLAAYAVLALLANNLGEIKVSDGYLSLALALLATALVFFLLRSALGDWRRAALACTVLVIGFFSYGHVYNYLKTNPLFTASLGRHRMLAPLWLVLFLAGFWWSVRKVRDLDTATLGFNVLAISALVFPLVRLGAYDAKTHAAVPAQNNVASQRFVVHPPAGAPRPDIYYIILDAYTRDDILAKEFKIDNEPFLDELEESGFYIARCSQSNYAQTTLSLTSSLNFNYLEGLGVDTHQAGKDGAALGMLITHSAVRSILEGQGYTIVAFDSDFYRTQWEDADIYLSGKQRILGELNGFEVMLVETTMTRLVTDAALVFPRFLTPDLESPYRQRRNTILYTLDQLEKVPESTPSPKFVFAHIVAPHGPFVVGQNGEDVIIPEDPSSFTYVTGYGNQLIYLNKRLSVILKEIIRKSAVPPVIIIQGDHGAGKSSATTRMAILNAYHLPGEAGQHLYESISPVNSFRLVLSSYFGVDLPLLNDVSYYSVYQDPFNYKIIANQRAGCPDG